MQLDVYTLSDPPTEIIFEESKQFRRVKVEYKFLDREHELTEIEL